MDRESFLALLTKKIAGEIDEAEARQLALALETTEEYRHIHDGILLHASTAAVKADPEKKLAAVWSKIESRKAKPAISYLYVKLIAASVLAVMAFYWLMPKSTDTKSMITLSTKGQKLDTILSDGSHIILNENSNLSFNKNFGEKKRSVILQGHAFFDVAKNGAVPMIIEAGPVNIMVKGTAFYVSSGNTSTEVKLIRGLVEVSNRRDRNDKLLLKPNQVLLVDQTGNHNLQYAVANLPAPEAAPVLNTDTLNFNKKRLDSLVVLLERKYNAEIEIRNEALKSKRFSGRFTTESLKQALEALRFTYPFSFRMGADNIIVIE